MYCIAKGVFSWGGANGRALRSFIVFIIFLLQILYIYILRVVSFSCNYIRKVIFFVQEDLLKIDYRGESIVLYQIQNECFE